MAMKTASPWWFSALFAVGLLLVFLGERPFDHIDTLRTLFTGVGMLIAVAVTGLRAWTFAATRGERRSVERILLLSHIGTLVALIIYALTTHWGQGLVGVDTLEPKSLQRFLVPMTVVWTILMAISLVPMLMVELSLGMARRTDFSPASMAKSDADEEAVESFRVREMASSGLTVALAAALLFTTCNVAKQRNIRKDVSYFKTSSPGSATVNVVKSVSEPVKVYLFFPKVNEIKNEIRGYFELLKDATGNIEIEEHDRLLSAALAKQFKVNEDGVVIVAYGDKNESIKFTVDIQGKRDRTARTQLRELDSKVNAAMMKVVRARRTVYLTVGHGEFNDTESEWTRMGMRSGEFKRRLREMNYNVKDLGANQGLSNEIPDDANLVMMLAPQQTLLDEELASLDRYLARGGRLLVILDPKSNASLGLLEGRLGVHFEPTPLADEKLHMARTRTPSDRTLIVTNRFSAHASITTLSRAAANYGMPFLTAGSLREVEFAEGKAAAKRTHVIRSMPNTFADQNGNFAFDPNEKREQYNLVTAIEDPTAKSDKPAEGTAAADEGMRAMVLTDIDIFEDYILLQLGGAQAMLDDAVKWLGGEEHFAGEIVSEKDVVIEHTRNEDVLWFYATIVGAPLVVLAFGMWFGFWRRTRTQRRSS